MITRWYVGFNGDYNGREKRWWDIFTCNEFRHCMLLGYDPQLGVWLYYDPTMNGAAVEIFCQDDPSIDMIIQHFAVNGKWLKVKPQKHLFVTGLWRLYCVTAVKHILGIKSSALTPKGLYRDLVKAGATPVFEVNKDGRTEQAEEAGTDRRGKRTRRAAKERARASGSRKN